MTGPATTQNFTEITDIKEGIVLFGGGNASLVIEISSSNFALLSLEEQDSRVRAYASFLNSLGFPIQILVNNRRVDISSYILLLQEEIEKITNPTIETYMQGYKAFVQELVKENIVLDKRFYIIVSYSSLESGAVSTIKNSGTKDGDQGFFENAKASLHTKADSVRNQLGRINLSSKIVSQEDLVRLFYEMYNPLVQTSSQSKIPQTTIIQGGSQ